MTKEIDRETDMAGFEKKIGIAGSGIMKCMECMG